MKKGQTKKAKLSPIKSRRFLMYFFFMAFFVFLGFWYHNKYLKERVSIIDSSHIENIEKIELERRIREMVKGHPIEEMVPFIMEHDQIVSIFLVSIAKKESNWGKRIPVYKGKDCFNYWGYRGPNRLGSGGHSCFSSREEAVDIVGKRLAYLVKKAGKDTPAKMIVWKCGSSCKTHSSFGVRKWISDVNLYFQKLSE